jgi:flagellar biogenesis protein FliO
MSPEQPNPIKSSHRFNIFSEGMNIFQIIFLLLSIVCFLSMIGVLLYQVWGLVSGQGWNTIYLAHALYFLFGDAPQIENMSTLMKIFAVLSFIPLFIVLAALGWLFMKISEGFETLS